MALSHLRESYGEELPDVPCLEAVPRRWSALLGEDVLLVVDGFSDSLYIIADGYRAIDINTQTAQDTCNEMSIGIYHLTKQ